MKCKPNLTNLRIEVKCDSASLPSLGYEGRNIGFHGNQILTWIIKETGYLL